MTWQPNPHVPGLSTYSLPAAPGVNAYLTRPEGGGIWLNVTVLNDDATAQASLALELTAAQRSALVTALTTIPGEAGR